MPERIPGAALLVYIDHRTGVAVIDPCVRSPFTIPRDDPREIRILATSSCGTCEDRVVQVTALLRREGLIVEVHKPDLEPMQALTAAATPPPLRGRRPTLKRRRCLEPGCEVLTNSGAWGSHRKASGHSQYEDVLLDRDEM